MPARRCLEKGNAGVVLLSRRWVLGCRIKDSGLGSWFGGAGAVRSGNLPFGTVKNSSSANYKELRPGINEQARKTSASHPNWAHVLISRFWTSPDALRCSMHERVNQDSSCAGAAAGAAASPAFWALRRTPRKQRFSASAFSASRRLVSSSARSFSRNRPPFSPGMRL